MNDRYVLITGASTGIGEAVAYCFAKEGYIPILTARTEDTLNKVQSRIVREGGKSEVLSCDLSKIEEINTLIGKVKDITGNLHAIINAAAIWHGEHEVYADIDFDQFEQRVILDTYTVGLTAPTLLVHGLLSIMPANSKVVNVSGQFLDWIKGWVPYYVSKRALEDLTIGLAKELRDRNIQVNCISPTDVATPAYEKFFPQYIDEAVSPDIIAREVLTLCSTTNTETGRVYVVEKGKEPYERFHA